MIFVDSVLFKIAAMHKINLEKYIYVSLYIVLNKENDYAKKEHKHYSCPILIFCLKHYYFDKFKLKFVKIIVFHTSYYAIQYHS